MHHRYDKNHVPIELLRTLAAIGSLNSFTKAADHLGLTQSAVSVQVKRLQQLVGGDIFDKSGAGLTLNQRGNTVAKYARRILDMNDQMLLQTGTQSTSRVLRIGIPTAFSETMLTTIFTACVAAKNDGKIQLQYGASADLLESLNSGYLDFGMIICQSDQSIPLTAEWQEPFVWACSHDLLVSPGAPIPLIVWPNGVAQRMATDALEKAGLRYAAAFVGADATGCVAAARAGLGFMPMPERAVSHGLKIAREHYLPSLPSVRAGISLREGLDPNEIKPILRAFESIVRPLAQSGQVTCDDNKSKSNVQRIASQARMPRRFDVGGKPVIAAQ